MAHIVRVKSRKVDGWQVRAGPRGQQLTEYVALAKFKDEAKAFEHAQKVGRRLDAQAEPVRPITGPRTKAQKNNRSGLVGIKCEWRGTEDNPTLYVVATWSRNRKPCATALSTQKHGILKAVELALQARAKGTGVEATLSPRQAWAVLKEHSRMLGAPLGGEAL